MHMVAALHFIKGAKEKKTIGSVGFKFFCR